jgi:hypothetical protein
MRSLNTRQDLEIRHSRNYRGLHYDMFGIFMAVCQDDMVIGYIYPANAKLTFNGIDMICSISENILNGLTTQSPIRDTALARLQNNSMPWWRLPL